MLVGGLLAATLVRFAPGFDVDERELDTRLNQQSIAAIRGERTAEPGLGRFYIHYLSRLVHGDLGFSRALNRPAAELIGERFPITAKEIGIALLAAWCLALLMAVPVAMRGYWPADLISAIVTAGLVSIPAAVLAVLFFLLSWPASLAIALVLVPKIFAYTRNLLVRGYAMPHVLTARSKGLSETRVFLWHVVPAAAPQLLALAGVSVSIAIGAAVPIEALCDQPGIGQLVWQAALARDLVLLVNLTLVVTLVTVIANSASDLLGAAMQRDNA
jgi:peptide/nickel transport system permease protein